MPVCFLIFLMTLAFQANAFGYSEKACREEIGEHILKAASTLTSFPVEVFSNLKSTGKKIKSAYGETLHEYTATDLAVEGGWIPNSSVAVYVKRNEFGCFVVRMHVNLR